MSDIHFVGLAQAKFSPDLFSEFLSDPLDFQKLEISRKKRCSYFTTPTAPFAAC